MHFLSRTNALALVLCAFTGCIGSAQIELDERDASVPCLRAETEFRFSRRAERHWELPALPVTSRAQARSWVDPRIGNSLFLRAELIGSRRDVDETCVLPPWQYAEIDDQPLNPGPIGAHFAMDREELLFRAGLCTRGRILRLGGGLHIAFMQLRGDLFSGDLRYRISSSNLALGPGLLVEVSPACPPVRGYLDARIEFGGGLGERSMEGQVSMTCEVGFKFTHAGLLAFAGYRFENHFLEWYEGPEIRLRLEGPVLGVGLAF